MCNYNPKCSVSLCWMIDDTIVDLFMNAAHKEKSSLTITCFPKSNWQHYSVQRFHSRLYVERATHDIIESVRPHKYIDKVIFQ